jgi:hypothetical protein
LIHYANMVLNVVHCLWYNDVSGVDTVIIVPFGEQITVLALSADGKALRKNRSLLAVFVYFTQRTELVISTCPWMYS